MSSKTVWEDHWSTRLPYQALCWTVDHPRSWFYGAVIVLTVAALSKGPVGWAGVAVGAVLVVVWAVKASASFKFVTGIGLTPKVTPAGAAAGAPLELTMGTLTRPARPLPPPMVIPDVRTLARIPVGVRVGQNAQWELNLLTQHTLIIGDSGAGKSGVIQSTLVGLAPFVRCGVVEVHAIDPKGGMELGPVADMFSRFAFADDGDMATLLADTVADMRARAVKLRQRKMRQHLPTLAEPLRIILLDELNVLSNDMEDPKIQKAINASIKTIGRMGRAVGFLVVAAVQDPRVEALPNRRMFQNRVCLKVERGMVDMVLGAGAREAGALADEISDKEPGVGYVMENGTPVRVKAYWHDDADIERMAAAYRPTR